MLCIWWLVVIQLQKHHEHGSLRLKWLCVCNGHNMHTFKEKHTTDMVLLSKLLRTCEAAQIQEDPLKMSALKLSYTTMPTKSRVPTNICG